MLVGIYRGIILAGFLGWCRISSVHSSVPCDYVPFKHHPTKMRLILTIVYTLNVQTAQQVEHRFPEPIDKHHEKSIHFCSGFSRKPCCCWLQSTSFKNGSIFRMTFQILSISKLILKEGQMSHSFHILLLFLNVSKQAIYKTFRTCENLSTNSQRMFGLGRALLMLCSGVPPAREQPPTPPLAVLVGSCFSSAKAVYGMCSF